MLMTIVSSSMRKQASATLPTINASLKPVTYSVVSWDWMSTSPASLLSEDVISGGDILATSLVGGLFASGTSVMIRMLLMSLKARKKSARWFCDGKQFYTDAAEDFILLSLNCFGDTIIEHVPRVLAPTRTRPQSMLSSLCLFCVIDLYRTLDHYHNKFWCTVINIPTLAI